MEKHKNFSLSLGKDKSLTKKHPHKKDHLDNGAKNKNSEYFKT